jgi:hypothetical protein
MLIERLRKKVVEQGESILDDLEKVINDKRAV